MPVSLKPKTHTYIDKWFFSKYSNLITFNLAADFELRKFFYVCEIILLHYFDHKYKEILRSSGNVLNGNKNSLAFNHFIIM